MLNGIILFEKALYPLSLLLGVPKAKTTYTKSRPETIFQLLTFTFDPSSMSSGVIILQRPYVSFSSPLLLILRREVTAAAVALFYIKFQIIVVKNGLLLCYTKVSFVSTFSNIIQIV